MADTASSATSNLLGHDEAMQQVAAAFASGRMHHAWLMVGADGIGKTTLAYHIANHVLSSGQNPLGRIDLQHRITRLVMAESHPDMLVVRRAVNEKTGEMRNVIVVEDAVKVGAFLRRTSTHGGWRVVIIDEIHTMNNHSQNAILKIIEEPPPQALILMTATTPGAMLPTIRSRCRVLNLAPLGETQMRAVLLRNAPDTSSNDLDLLLDMAEGSIGFALKIIRSEALPLYQELTSILSLPSLDLARLHALADRLGRKADAESFEVVTDLLINQLRRDISAGAHRGINLDILGNKLDVWDSTRAMFNQADYANLDKKLAFTLAMMDLHEATA